MSRRSGGAFTTNADTAEAPHTASTISPLTGRLPATPGRPPEAPGRPPVASGRPGRLPGVSGAGGPAEASPAATTLADLDQAVPAQLEWVGAIADVTAQRIAGDADIWRIILDPATSQPLNVGRAHRLVPAWLRKALHARDRGCRFPGCHPRSPGPTPTTYSPGPTAAPPTSTTSSCSAATTTDSSTKDDGASRSTPARSPPPDPTADPTNSTNPEPPATPRDLRARVLDARDEMRAGVVAAEGKEPTVLETTALGRDPRSTGGSAPGRPDNHST